MARKRRPEKIATPDSSSRKTNMSEEQKYKDWIAQQLQHLAVPDEEQAWQHMKEKLEQKEEEKRIVPPFLISCAGWSLLFLLLLSGGLYLLWPAFKKAKQLPHATQKNSADTMQQTNEPYKNAPVAPSTAITLKDGHGALKIKNKPATANPYTSQVTPQSNGNAAAKYSTQRPVQLKKQQTHFAILEKPFARKKNSTTKRNVIQSKAAPSVYQQNKINTLKAPVKYVTDTAWTFEKDSTHAVADTILKTKPADRDTPAAHKTDSKKPKKQKHYYVGAGLALFQQLPLAGQNMVPYNQYGRSGSLADYLPAPYFRLHKENSWFVQADFRYGAPQATKELAYHVATIIDSGMQRTTNTTLRVKKTFYHQASFGFHYAVLSNWTVGAGGMYSRFYGAVSEQEIRSRNNQNGIETVSKTLLNVPARNDSTFTASQLNVLLQTEYSRKRWGAGLRYTQGLQPFIRYTQGGRQNEERNHALQLYIRFRLWQSKKQ
jgi:hypothetical protein